jgi:hypothetical protein
MSEHDNSSEPVECYEFWVSGYGYYRYTSDATTVLAESKTYAPLKGLSRANIACVVSNDAGDFYVQVPVNTTLVRLCGMFKTPAKVTLAFRRYQRNNLNVPTMTYNAILDGVTIDGEICKFKLPDTFNNATASVIPRHKAQSQCNWVLGDSNCQKDVSQWLLTYKAVAYATTYDGDPITNRLRVDGSNYAGPPYKPRLILPGGIIEANRYGQIETRTINVFEPIDFSTNMSGYMTINAPFNLPVDDITKFRLALIGCDNSTTACLAFENLNRFGGFPHMPTEKYNPFLVRLNRARRG